MDHSIPGRKFVLPMIVKAEEALPGDTFVLFRREWEVTNTIHTEWDTVVIQCQSHRTGKVSLESELELNLKQWFEIDRRS